jgi:hypothetical protein
MPLACSAVVAASAADPEDALPFFRFASPSKVTCVACQRCAPAYAAAAAHGVELRLVPASRLELALVDAAHARGLGDTAGARLAGRQCAYVGAPVLAARVVHAHVVDTDVAGPAVRQLHFVPEAGLGRDRDRSVLFEGLDLGGLEFGLGIDVHFGLPDHRTELFRTGRDC